MSEIFNKKKQRYIEDSYKQGLITYQRYCEDMVDLTKDMYDAELDAQKAYVNAVIKVMEKEKEALEERKEAYEKQSSDIETTVSTVTKFIDKQIQALRDENSELDSQLKIRKALEALELAKSQRNKRIFVAGEGFVWRSDDEAIKNAQEEYDQLVKEDELEQKIKALEDYKEQWQDVVDSYQQGIDEQITADLLGADWQQIILALKTDNLNTFKNNYHDINDQLNKDVAGSVASQIENLNKLIDKWRDSIDDITDDSARYEGLLDSVAQFELMNYDQRLAHLDVFVTQSREKLQSLIDSYNLLSDAMGMGEIGGSSSGGTGTTNSPSGTLGKGWIDGIDYEAEMQAVDSYEGLKTYATARDKKIADLGIDVGAEGWKTTQEIIDEWWEKNSGKYGYSKGGVVDYTGLAQLHGRPGYEEVIFNSGDAKKLFEYVTTTPSLVQDFIEKAFENKKSEYAPGAPQKPIQPLQLSIGDIYLTDVQDVDGLAKAIKQRLPVELIQQLYGR